MREFQKSVYPYTARMALLDFTKRQLIKDEQQLLEDFGRPNESAAIDWKQMET